MLGKLLKYELKANLILYLIMTAIVAGVTLACCGSLELMIRTKSENPYINLSFMSIIIVYIIVLVATSIFTTVIIFKRFYSNNFGQEGYLTFTLPVTAKQIYWSKFISALIWNCWTGILTAASLLAVIMCPSLELSMADVMTAVNFFVSIYCDSILISTLYVVQCIVSILYGICIMYLAICIGQNFNVHRVIGAIGAYFAVRWGVSIISRVISTTVLIIWMVIKDGQYDYNSNFLDGYIIPILVVQIIVYIAAMIGSYFYSIRKMSKGLNLK